MAALLRIRAFRGAIIANPSKFGWECVWSHTLFRIAVEAAPDLTKLTVDCFSGLKGETFLTNACKYGHVVLLNHILSVPDLDLKRVDANGEGALDVLTKVTLAIVAVQPDRLRRLIGSTPEKFLSKLAAELKIVPDPIGGVRAG